MDAAGSFSRMRRHVEGACHKDFCEAAASPRVGRVYETLACKIGRLFRFEYLRSVCLAQLARSDDTIMDLIAGYGEDESNDEDAVGLDSHNESDIAAPSHLARAPRLRTSLPVHIYIEVEASLAGSAALQTATAAYTSWFARALVPLAPDLLANARWCMLPDAAAYVRTPLHCSLSRYFEVSEPAASAFITALREALAPKTSGSGGAFSLSLDGCVALTASREARCVDGFCAVLFLAAMVGAGRPRVLALLERVDAVMRAHGLPVYYTPAEPHVSLAVLRAPPGTSTIDAAAALAAAGVDAISAADVNLEGAPPLTFSVSEVSCKIGKRVFKIMI